MKSFIIGLLLFFAIPAWGTQFCFEAGGAIFKSTNAASRTPVDGTNFPLIVLDFANTGTPEAYWSGTVPNSIAGVTWTPIWHWYSASTSAGNVCWNVSVTAFSDDTLGDAVAMETEILASTSNEVSSANITSVALSNNRANGTAYSPKINIGGDVSGTCISDGNCGGLPLRVKIWRNNSGGCTSNLAATGRLQKVCFE